MKEFFKMLVVKFNFGTPAGNKLYYTAQGWLGKDASPSDEAPDEYGCAETVNAIVERTFGKPIGGDVSTYRMYYAIRDNKKFVEVKKPIRGDIILSPTGYGNGSMNNGHVGIVGLNGVVMSNSSAGGLFLEKYSVLSWKERYGDKGGYPVLFYRRVFL
jgi:hypothetical protein